MTSIEPHPRSSAGPAPRPAAGTEAEAQAADTTDPLVSFWQERRYATLTTLRPDGTPHVVPVSVTYEPAPGTEGSGAAGTARVVTRGTSKKARNIEAAGAEGMRVALCQVDGRRWSTLEGRARIRTEPSAIADAERRYEARYGRRPRPNPERVLIEVSVDRALGRPA